MMIGPHVDLYMGTIVLILILVPLFTMTAAVVALAHQSRREKKVWHPSKFDAQSVVAALANVARTNGYAAYVDRDRRIVLRNRPELNNQWCAEYDAHRTYHSTLSEAEGYLLKRSTSYAASSRSLKSRLKP